MTSTLKRRRIFVPERTHMSKAEKNFARSTQNHVRALRNYADTVHDYRVAKNAVYKEYNVPLYSQPMMSGNRNYSLESRLRNVNNRSMTPAQRAFSRVSNRMRTVSKVIANSLPVYRAASVALRQEYQMVPFLVWNRNQMLENRLKNRTIQTLQRRVRQKQTGKRIAATAAFIGSMNKKGFTPELTRKIINSLNRRG